MVTLVNIFGFLVQMVLCPLVMLPWLFIRLVIALLPVAEEMPRVDVYEYEYDYEHATPAFG